MKRLAILALSLATALSGVPPAGAFPIMPAAKTEATDVQRVQFPYERGEDRKDGRCRNPGCYRWDHRHGRYRDYRHHHRYSYRDRYRHRHHHHGSNFGAVIGGLAAGALIGGLLAQPRYYGGGGSAHTRWCYARYRSYRAYDNTFQPYHGPRRACISPYL
ncbi:BA14K family protein [Ensifer sp. LCM 4579]|uniref:BA14K family protein n=1 Tax=Ensifer sp. LCM 4579 TaxID=1848292 RepID=UPI0008D8FB98|nr:BA14K family protein [Ensifer sp. LCM 4579]OHV77991.1 hypothetical protein LCM4579_06475 [Ensifer sp. LCM 4579]